MPTQRAPDVPVATDANPKMIDYLRRNNIWAFEQLTKKLDKLEATSQIYMQSPDGKVWAVTVSNAGALVVTSVPIGTRI